MPSRTTTTWRQRPQRPTLPSCAWLPNYPQFLLTIATIILQILLPNPPPPPPPGPPPPPPPPPPQLGDDQLDPVAMARVQAFGPPRAVADVDPLESGGARRGGGRDGGGGQGKGRRVGRGGRR